MENLTKENFWNELQVKYPRGMQVFCDWIDQYKKKSNWEKLFNNGGKTNYDSPIHNIKFHDIPYAMQLGIWFEFICSQESLIRYRIEDLLEYNLKEDISKTKNIQLHYIRETTS